MSIKFITTIFLIFVTFSNVDYAVTNTNLNLRESPTINSSPITILNTGDTVQISNIENGWANVRYKSYNGYVSSSYRTKIAFEDKDSIEEPKKEFKDQIGFVAGFKYVFYRTFLLIFIIVGAFITYKLRRPDARFKKGYREGKMSHFSTFKLAIYAAVISLLTGFIGGIISIFH